jgi:hypothetical protein
MARIKVARIRELLAMYKAVNAVIVAHAPLHLSLRACSNCSSKDKP